MARIKILFADDDPGFLKARAEFLGGKGYQVIPAATPVEARRILEQGQVDLAILDLRLTDDADEKDISGLVLAEGTAHSIPKIILTQYPTYEHLREALAPDLQDLPSAVDFVAKQEGPEALLATIRRTLRSDIRVFERNLSDISAQLQQDYKEGQYQAKVSYRASISLALLGVLLILAGVALTLVVRLDVGLIVTTSGIVTAAVSYLFFKRVDGATGRMDRYHSDWLQLQEWEMLLAACDKIDSPETKEKAKLEVIKRMREKWLEHLDSPDSRSEELPNSGDVDLGG